jgi:hypothetical protein
VSIAAIGEIVDFCIALTDVVLADRDHALSPDAARICALLITMPGPEIQTPVEFEFYRQQHGVRATREFDRESLPGLKKSLSKAHDNLSKQVGINTRLYAALTKANRSLRWQGIWVKILSTTVAAEFVVIGWLVKAFLDHFAR